MAFQEQFDRTGRWYERFRDLHHGRAHSKASDNYVDEIYGFFQNCYHLKDWIKNDTHVSRTAAAQVEPFINQSDALALCADLCNSQKHFTLHSPPRSGAIPQIGPKHFSLALGGSQATLSMRLSVQSGSTTWDAFDLATKCMEDWERFLRGLGYAVTAPSALPSAPQPSPSTGAGASAPTFTATGSPAELSALRKK